VVTRYFFFLNQERDSSGKAFDPRENKDKAKQEEISISGRKCDCPGWSYH